MTGFTIIGIVVFALALTATIAHLLCMFDIKIRLNVDEDEE